MTRGTFEEMLLAERDLILNKVIQDLSVDVEGDETDEIQGNILLEINKQLGFRDAAKLKLINAALAKIQEGVYGMCEDCEEQIPEKRLLINPCFTNCIGCAEDRELVAQRKRI